MDCMHALEECGGRLDDAALWLTHNAQPVPAPTVAPNDMNKNSAINFHAVEIKTGSVNICVIDDCGDCDVPLLELSLSHLGLKQVRPILYCLCNISLMAAQLLLIY